MLLQGARGPLVRQGAGALKPRPLGGQGRQCACHAGERTVAIIGGGMAGLGAALELCKAGVSVTLVERVSSI